MARTTRLWIPLLVGCLVAVLLGPAGGSAVTATEPRTVTASIMIPAAAFIPTRDDWDYYNGGLYLNAATGNSMFQAPLAFPVPQLNIRRITLYAFDDTAAQDVCASLIRSDPRNGAYGTGMGQVCTSDSALTPQVATTTAISPRRINTATYGPHLLVIVDPETTLYGVKVTYTYETGA